MKTVKNPIDDDKCTNGLYIGKTKCVYICTHCNSDNVEIKAWVKPNKNYKFFDEIIDDKIGWCDDCQLFVTIETVNLKHNTKIIGFQVVGDDGSKEEGMIHPKMAGSFCVYSLSQCTEMIKNSEGQWRLQSIWTGDIEEPTMMFKGNPRQ
jgi:hypothetical protein